MFFFVCVICNEYFHSDDSILIWQKIKNVCYNLTNLSI